MNSDRKYYCIMTYKTIFFKKTDSNKCNVYDYLINEIPKKTLIKVIEQMQKLEEFGLSYGHSKYKKFQNGMFKIRYNDGNNNCRIYFIIIENVIYYLYAYNKKTQKTPGNIKVKINNLKAELLEQLKNKMKYLNEFIDLSNLLSMVDINC